MKKVIAIFTMFSFLIFITSCHSYKTLTSQEEFNKYTGEENVEIIYVNTKKGGIIDFNEKYPGRISETGVVGMPQIRLQYGKVDSFSISEISDIEKFIWKNGVGYELITQDSLGFICHEPYSIQIPFSDIEKLRLRRPDMPKTVFLICGTVGIFIGIITRCQPGELY